MKPSALKLALLATATALLVWMSATRNPLNAKPTTVLATTHLQPNRDTDPKISKNGMDGHPIRQNLVAFAKAFIGTPYSYAHASPETGFDCSGFVSYVFQNFGIQVSRSSAVLANEGRYISLDAARTGDIIIFGTSSKIQHVALVVSNTDEGIICIHSTSSRGVIIENVSRSSYWRPLILSARDVIGY